MTPGKRQLRVKQQGIVTVVRFASSDLQETDRAAAVGVELMELVEASKRTRILVDFDGVEAVSSSLIGKLVAVRKKLEALGGEIKLCSIEAPLLEILRTMTLDTVFEILPDEQAALPRFRGAMIG